MGMASYNTLVYLRKSVLSNRDEGIAVAIAKRGAVGEAVPLKTDLQKFKTGKIRERCSSSCDAF